MKMDQRSTRASRSSYESLRPVFIVGAARSGTSLLYKTLALHPDVGYISNWVGRFPRFPWLAILNTFARSMPEVRRRVWFDEQGNAYVYGNRRPLVKRLFPMPVEGEPVYARAGFGLNVTRADPESIGRLDRAFRQILAHSDSAVFVTKRIGNIHRMHLLRQAFPRARYVRITRDGRAVALSLSKVDWWRESVLPWLGMTPADWEASGGDPWELCARNWVEEVMLLEKELETVDRTHVFDLSYEALIDDPIGVLTATAGFMELAPRPDWLVEVKSLAFSERTGSRRTSADPVIVDKITRIQALVLQQHGYLP